MHFFLGGGGALRVKYHLLFKYHIVKMQDIMCISKSNFKPQVSMNKQVGAYITSAKTFFFTV